MSSYFDGMGALVPVVWGLVAALALGLLTCGAVLGYGMGREQGRRDAMTGQSCEPRRHHAPRPSPDPAL